MPLPDDAQCYAIGASLLSKTRALSTELVGDGLVLLNSALGQHTDPVRKLSFRIAPVDRIRHESLRSARTQRRVRADLSVARLTGAETFRGYPTIKNTAKAATSSNGSSVQAIAARWALAA